MSTDKITIRVYARTSKIGSDSSTELEFDREEWESMSEEEREDSAREAMFELIEWGFEPIESR